MNEDEQRRRLAQVPTSSPPEEPQVRINLIIHRQMTEERFDFHGGHSQLTGCEARPKPLQTPRVPFVLGGGAGPRAARYADEYNAAFPTLEDAASTRPPSTPPAKRPAGRRSRSRS